MLLALSLTLCDPVDCSGQAFLSFTISWSLPELTSTESVMLCNHLIVLCTPLFLLLPSILPSIRALSSESALHIRWPKYWSFSFSISPSNEYSGLISSRIDRLDLLAVQGPLKSLLQHHSSKVSILQSSAFFMVQLWHPYMTTGKTKVFIGWTFVCKITSLLFNMLSWFVIVFLPRSKHILISWLQSPSAVILEPKNIKSVTVSIVSPSIFYEVMGLELCIQMGISFLFSCWKQWQTLFSFAPKSLQMVTAAMKLKYACSLVKKKNLWITLILKSRDIIIPTKVCLVKPIIFLAVMYGCES